MIHGRMPVIVPKDREYLRLDDSIENSAVLMPILKPYPADEMTLRWGMGAGFMASFDRQAIDYIRIYICKNDYYIIQLASFLTFCNYSCNPLL